jgi:DNA gyrase subunit A
MSLIPKLEKRFILSVTENGFGKRTPIEDYRMTNRGGQGVANIECSERNGPVVASYVASEDDQIMLVTNSGKLIRLRVNGGEGNSIRVASRKTQGVRLFDVDEGEKVVSVALLTDQDDEEQDQDQDSNIDNNN